MNLNSYIDTFISSDEKYDRIKFFNRNNYDFFRERDEIEILEIERKFREWRDKFTYSNWSWEEFKKESGSGKVYRDFHPSVLEAFENSHKDKDILTKKYSYYTWKDYIKSFLSFIEDDNENEEKSMTINEYIETLPENDKPMFKTWLARHTGYGLSKERDTTELKDIQKSFDEWLNKIYNGFWSWNEFKNEAYLGGDEYRLFDISVLDNFEKDKKNFDIIYTDEGESLRYKNFKYWMNTVNSSLNIQPADEETFKEKAKKELEDQYYKKLNEEEKETPTKLLLPTIPKKVAKSIASVMAFFDWAKVVDYEKQEGRFQDVDEIDALDEIKTTALNEMFDMVDDLSLKNEDYQWREAAHCLRYEYYKDSGFRLMYCPESADWIFDDDKED